MFEYHWTRILTYMWKSTDSTRVIWYLCTITCGARRVCSCRIRWVANAIYLLGTKSTILWVPMDSISTLKTCYDGGGDFGIGWKWWGGGLETRSSALLDPQELEVSATSRGARLWGQTPDANIWGQRYTWTKSTETILLFHSGLFKMFDLWPTLLTIYF